MSLATLPAEILLSILEYVGSAYFLEDVKRLMICKHWFACAKLACFKDLQLSQRLLRRMMTPQNVNDIETSIRQNTRSLRIALNGFQDWSALAAVRRNEPQTCVALNDGDAARVRAAHETLNEDLKKLATIIRRSQRLRELQITACSEYHPALCFLPTPDYLTLASMHSLLSLHALQVLDLDLVGTGCTTVTGAETLASSHVCPSISALLVSLKRLRLRMHRVCGDIFALSNDTGRIPLEEVIVNLSLSRESPDRDSAWHAGWCQTRDRSFHMLFQDLHGRATDLVTRMASPKFFRILTHHPVNFGMQSFDVLTGIQMRLKEGMAWEEEGEMDEDGSSTESPISEDDVPLPSDD